MGQSRFITLPSTVISQEDCLLMKICWRYFPYPCHVCNSYIPKILFRQRMHLNIYSCIFHIRVTSCERHSVKCNRQLDCSFRRLSGKTSKKLQYIPRNMHTVFALLCFVVVIHWLIFPYPSGLLHWHCGNLTIAPVPAKQPWWIWIYSSCEFIMNDCITTTKQSTTKPCAYFLGYTVCIIEPLCCEQAVRLLVPGGFATQRASKAETASMSSHYHEPCLSTNINLLQLCLIAIAINLLIDGLANAIGAAC